MPAATVFVGASHRPAPELVAIAKLADELGFDGMTMADHVVVPARRVQRYPYSGDGAPPFGAETLWTDVLLVATAAAVQTRRLTLATGVYILPLRHPLVVARAVASLEALAPGRVQLGVGVGWMKEEFDILGVDYHRRGALTDESIFVLRKLWAGGLVEHDGPGYPFEAMWFEPHPSRPIPILVGGTSPAALRRAARLGDGYVAMPAPAEQLIATIETLQALRAGSERDGEPLAVHTYSLPGQSVDEHRHLIEAGVTTFYVGLLGTLEEARSHLERFLEEIAEPLRSSGHLVAPEPYASSSAS